MNTSIGQSLSGNVLPSSSTAPTIAQNPLQPPSTHHKQTVIHNNDNGSVVPKVCAEKPRFFCGMEFVDALFYGHDSHTHSMNVRPCSNTAAHIDANGQHRPHHVCSTCRDKANAHILQVSPHLLSPNLWPLCELCGAFDLANAIRFGRRRLPRCICDSGWLCFECRVQKLEMAAVRGEVEGALDVNMGVIAPHRTKGWVCRCGTGPVEPWMGVLKCAGCEYLSRDNWFVLMNKERVEAFLRTLVWS